jgi:hypothetical protein
LPDACTDMMLATSILPRLSMLLTEKAARPICAHRVRNDPMASASVMSESRLDRKDSSECVIASMPVASTCSAGSVLRRLGSRIEIVACAPRPPMFIFTLRSGSVMIKTGDTSLPEPVVVVTSTVGTGAAANRFMPSIACSFLSGLVARSATARPRQMGEPPPITTTTSQRSDK